jgi:hypothetical protein
LKVLSVATLLASAPRPKHAGNAPNNEERGDYSGCDRSARYASSRGDREAGLIAVHRDEPETKVALREIRPGRVSDAVWTEREKKKEKAQHAS